MIEFSPEQQVCSLCRLPWQNCWPMKRCKPYFQLGILLKALTIANIWHSMSRIWTYTESEFICFLEWSCAVVIFITTWHHYRFVYVFISNFSTLNELKVTKNQKLIKKKNPIILQVHIHHWSRICIPGSFDSNVRLLEFGLSHRFYKFWMGCQ